MRHLLSALLLVPVLSFGQQIVVKPPFSSWKPSDFSLVEFRIVGRLSTDGATANRIIKRIPLKPTDPASLTSILTQRVTVSIPATETWQINAVAANFVPVASTNVESWEWRTKKFTTPYMPVSGQTLAIDFNLTTGAVVLGPVSVTPPPVLVWKTIATQHQSFTLASAKVVRYGEVATNRFFTKSLVSGSYVCDNAQFGDPAVGVDAKVCQTQ